MLQLSIDRNNYFLKSYFNGNLKRLKIFTFLHLHKYAIFLAFLVSILCGIHITYYTSFYVAQAGTPQCDCNRSMALTPEQVYKHGADSLGWNNRTDVGKTLIAEALVLLKKLQLAHTHC
jgi:hypothetical protein